MKRKMYPGGKTTGLRSVLASVTPVVERDGAGGGPVKFEIAVASEYVVERNFFGIAWREQLSMQPDAIQMKRFQSGSSPFLMDHSSRDQVGVIEKGSARVDTDNVLRAQVRMGDSARAKDAALDIVGPNAIRSNVSVGFLPKRWKLMEEDTEKGDLWLATLWEPVEASSVPIPADPTVGVGRSEGPGIFPVETELEAGIMKKKIIERGVVIEVDESDSRPAATQGELDALARAAGGQQAPPRNRNKEMTEIAELCEANKVPLKREWIERDLTPDQVGREILELIRTRGASSPAGEVAVPIPTKDAKRYSYARAILVAAGEAKQDGIEAEVDAEIRKNLPVTYRRPEGMQALNSILVPVRLEAERAQRASTALSTATPTQGAETVFDRPGELIDIYRNKAMVARAGARILTGLVGNIAFPKKTGFGTVYWVPENPGVAVTETNLTYGLLILSPKTLMGTEAYSRQFLLQAPSSGIDGEGMVRDDLGTGHALAFDLAALHGLGGNGQPIGLYNIPAVLTNSMAATVPTFAKLVDMLGKIGDANAPTDNLKWMTTPLMASVMMRTLVSSVAGAGMIWTGALNGGQMTGYTAFSTNQCRKNLGAGADEHATILGDFTEMILGTWNAMELIVDPYSKKKEGLIEVTSFQMGDVLVRQPTAFCVTSGAKIA
jgi:HK97 family phage major capsid protein